ncbi:hypothetical protein HDU86_007152 [Geranomyces michiganensis]|nr:hypothetical protein HDU86_007152 [Geranomyces michiganensis]
MSTRQPPPDTPPTPKPTANPPPPPPTPPVDPPSPSPNPPVVPPTPKPPVVVPPAPTPVVPPVVVPPVVVPSPAPPPPSAPPPVVVTQTQTRPRSTVAPVAIETPSPVIVSQTLLPTLVSGNGAADATSLPPGATPGATGTSLSAVGTGNNQSSGLGVGAIIAIVCAVLAVVITALAFVCFRRRRGASETRLRNEDRVDFNNPSGHGSLWRQALKKPSLGRTPGLESAAAVAAGGGGASSMAMSSPVTSTAALVPPSHMLGHEYGDHQRPISPALAGAYYQDPALAYDGHNGQYYQDPHASYDPRYYQDPNQQQAYYGDGGYYDQPAGQPYYDGYYDHQGSYDPNTVDAGEFPTGARPVRAPPSA